MQDTAESIHANIEQHAERLAWHQESWSSIELRGFRTETHERPIAGQPDRPPAFDGRQFFYVETAEGERFLDARALKSGEVKYRQTFYFDGKEGAEITWDPDAPLRQQRQIIVHRHFGREDRETHTQRPYPLRSYWMDREPLHEALPKAVPLGQAKVLERDCDRILFQNTGHTGEWEQIYDLDAETSTPLRVAVYRNEADRLADRLLMDWTALELGQVQGYPLALKSHLRAYTAEGGKHSWTQTYEVESAAFNKEYPASTFRPEIQPGALVHDQVRGKAVRMPGENQAERPAQRGADPSTTAAVADPIIRADPPRSWSFYTTTAGLGLGCAALMIGFLLWWRRG